MENNNENNNINNGYNNYNDYDIKNLNDYNNTDVNNVYNTYDNNNYNSNINNNIETQENLNNNANLNNVNNDDNSSSGCFSYISLMVAFFIVSPFILFNPIFLILFIVFAISSPKGFFKTLGMIGSFFAICFLIVFGLCIIGLVTST